MMSVATVSESAPVLDPWALRADFPALDQPVNGHPLVYLDNGATTQKPRAVIDAVTDFYRRDNANVHRGVHQLSQRASDRFDHAREQVRSLINATSCAEVIFTRGTTEAINLVAQSYGRSVLKNTDEILVSAMEHHANIALVRGYVVDWLPIQIYLSMRCGLEPSQHHQASRLAGAGGA